MGGAAYARFVERGPTVQVFGIRYGRWRPLFSVVGLGPRFSRVELGAVMLRVRMGWGFRGRFDQRSVARAGRFRDWPWAIGVHGNFRGAWLVNGSGTGLLFLDLEPPGRARVLGWPVKVRKLGLGLDDPDGFLAALGAPGAVPREATDA
jgi:hypothetical protein